MTLAEGEHALLKISPVKGVMWFGVKGKLAPRYIGPFLILERIGLLAYRLALPPAYMMSFTCPSFVATFQATHIY
jgi:hypothetical protein